MSRRNPSPGEILVQLPWWVSAALAICVYVGIRWGFLLVHTDNSFTESLIPALAKLAWIPALGLGILSVFSAILAKRKRALVDEQTSLGSLRELSWKEFEWLVGEAYRRQGYAVEELLGGGADGGVDLILRKNGGVWLVQCKQWRTQAVGAPTVREIFGLVTHHQANGAIVITSGRFTREAHAFAEGKTLELIDGPRLLALVKSVQARPTTPPAAAAVISMATVASSPVTAPGCPQCNAPMVRRTARKDPTPAMNFGAAPPTPSAAACGMLNPFSQS